MKAQILADAKLRTDFDGCVDLFKTYLGLTKHHSNINDVQIAAVSSESEPQADMSVEDRYYTKPEYKDLTAAQKMGLKLKRQKRGHKPLKAKKKQNNGSSKFKLTNRQVKAVIMQLQKASIKEDPEDEAMDDEPATATSNRNNKALKRKKWWGGNYSNTSFVKRVKIASVRVVRVGTISSKGDVQDAEQRSELDSHADTCVFGDATALITQDFDQPVRVLGYDGSIGEKESCKTVTADVAYDHPQQGKHTTFTSTKPS